MITLTISLSISLSISLFSISFIDDFTLSTLPRVSVDVLTFFITIGALLIFLVTLFINLRGDSVLEVLTKLALLITFGRPWNFLVYFPVLLIILRGESFLEALAALLIILGGDNVLEAFFILNSIPFSELEFGDPEKSMAEVGELLNI